MLRRSLWLPGAALAILALAACSLPPIDFNPTIEDTFTAQVVPWPGGTPTPRVTGISLREGRTIFYRVEMPSDRRDLLFAELVAAGASSGLRLSLVTELGFTRAVSDSPSFFSATVGGLAASGAVEPDRGAVEPDRGAVERSSISAEFACIGPCAAVRAPALSFLIKIENTATTARTFDLFGYTMDATDENEPNDSPGSAVAFSGQTVLRGAIETLDDVDWFLYTGSQLRELRFDTFDPALGLTLQIDGGGPTLRDGDEDVIYPGERFRVRPAAGRAGPSSTSGYAVTIGSVVTTPIDATVTAQDTTSPSPLLSASVAAGATRTYQVNLATARDLLYAEAVGSNLRVRLLSLGGSTLAVSDSPAYFTAGLSRSAAGVEAGPTPAAISVQFACDGPCAAVRPTAGAYLVEVQNLAAAPRSFSLYAYTFDANDLNDRGSASNDSMATATVISANGTFGGAIEWLGDEDWFRFTGTSERVLEFWVLDTAPGVRLRFDNGTILEGTLGGLTTTIEPNDRFMVFSASDRAGPSATSGYFLMVSNP